MKQFLKAIVNEFEVGPNATHIAVIAYSSTPKVIFGFKGLSGNQLNATAVKMKLDDIPHSRGLTFIDKALKLAYTQVFNEQKGMRKDVPKVKRSNSYCLYPATVYTQFNA